LLCSLGSAVSDQKPSLRARLIAGVRDIFVDSNRELTLEIPTNSCQPLPDSDNPSQPQPDSAGLGLGALRTAKEHAEAVARTLRGIGAVDTAIRQNDLEDLHAEMCGHLGWLHRKWGAVGRELARLPGVEREVVRVGEERLTVYQIAPSAEVIALDARRRAC
jgi:hypothetical protein